MVVSDVSTKVPNPPGEASHIWDKSFHIWDTASLRGLQRGYRPSGSPYWLGLHPYWAMKQRVKYDGEPNPTM